MGISICVHAFIAGVVILNPSIQKKIKRETEPLTISVNSFIEPTKEVEVSSPKPPLSKTKKPKESESKNIDQAKEIIPEKNEPKKPIISEPKPPKPIIKPIPKEPKPEQIVPKKVEKPIQKPQPRASEDFNLPPMKSSPPVQNKIEEVVASNQPLQATHAKNLTNEIAKAKTIEPAWDKMGYLSEVKATIIRYKSYPTRARKMKMQGEVVVSFTILPTGEMVKLAVEKSSGYGYLDSHTIETIKDASRVFPKPLEEIKVQIPIEYRLY